MLNLLGGLLGGGKGGALETISKVVDELHTSEEEKLDKKILMQRIQQKLAEKQLDVNAKEASHRSVFVAGWRPALGWVGVSAIAYNYVLLPLINIYLVSNSMDVLSPMDLSELMPLILGMLGLGGYRTYEKKKGVAK